MLHSKKAPTASAAAHLFFLNLALSDVSHLMFAHHHNLWLGIRETTSNFIGCGTLHISSVLHHGRPYLESTGAYGCEQAFVKPKGPWKRSFAPRPHRQSQKRALTLKQNCYKACTHHQCIELQIAEMFFGMSKTRTTSRHRPQVKARTTHPFEFFILYVRPLHTTGKEHHRKAQGGKMRD